MKKIIFMIIDMNIGGMEKALLNMIDEIPREKYEITILMLENRGGFLNDIPRHIKVKYLENYIHVKEILNNPPKDTILRLIKNKDILGSIKLSLIYLKYKISRDRSAYFKYVLKKFETIKEEYDIAVAYAGPMEFITYYVLKKVKAKEKYQWIHFDVSKIGFNRRFSNKYFKKFDKVIAVSEEAREALIEICPNLQNKISVKLNTIPRQDIIRKSKLHKGFDDNFNGIRILTVGRLSEEKGQDIAIKTCKRLIDDGFNIRWYCVGEGPLFNKCKDLIDDLEINNSFKLLGAKKNPYPYMRECDIYVQPSRHEGFCITLGEANVFNKPIVANNFVGAREQIGNKENCYIVDNRKDMYDIIKKLLNQKEINNAQDKCYRTNI